MAKKQNESNSDSLQSTIDHLNKTYGSGTILTLESKGVKKYETFSSGSLGFDWIALGVGGFAKGKVHELMGWEGCLSEDTYIKFINVREDGIVQDCKGGTIKNLYERFHNRTEKTQQTVFNITSINENDRVFRNRIIDVVKSGVKECFRLCTKKGFNIEVTKDHKFYTETNYLPLSELKVGSIVFVHNNTPYRKEDAKLRSKYAETTLKWYYKGKPKKVNGYYYFREKVHRLVYEAFMNNISYEEYKLMLNSSSSLPPNWNTIPEGFDVHHIDENTLNNSIENLELIDMRQHARTHALDRHDNLRFIVVPDEVVSIESVGMKETYDIKCGFPYNNFIAQGIVVHNSGKSTICIEATADCQRKGGTALYIDGEHAMDRFYFESLGVDLSKLLIAQPSTGEEGFNIALEMINSGKIDLLIIDSDSALLPKAVVEGEIGESAIGKKARLNNEAYPKIKSAASRNNVCVIVVSQFREKIGVMYGNPTVTQGGHALKFYSDTRTEISKQLAKNGEIVYGNLTKIKVTKNKMSAPFKGVSFDIIYGEGVDKIGELVILGEELGILKKAGTWISYNETKLGQGMFKVKQLLIDNPELYEELYEKIIIALTS